MHCNQLQLLRKKYIIKSQLIMKMLTITEGLHLNIFHTRADLIDIFHKLR